MRVISYGTIRKFIEKHPKGDSPLNGWYKIVEKSNWSSFDDVKKTFSSADGYRKCIIFNIGGNNYRLIARIDYKRFTIYIKKILTHSDYDKDKWKSDCKD